VTDITLLIRAIEAAARGEFGGRDPAKCALAIRRHIAKRREVNPTEARVLENAVLKAVMRRALAAATAAWAEVLPLFANGLPLPKGRELNEAVAGAAKEMGLSRRRVVIAIDPTLRVAVDLYHNGAVDAARVRAAWRLLAASRWRDRTRRRLAMRRHSLSLPTLRAELALWEGVAAECHALLDGGAADGYGRKFFIV
jgi:hypothetical protein